MISEKPRTVTASLECLAERMGDPKDAIYSRLFALYPDLEQLFFLDTNGDVRGEMLSQAFDVLMKAEAGNSQADILVRAARFAHDGYGVSEVQFDIFFDVLREVTQEALQEDWTRDTESAWLNVLAQLKAN